MSTPISITPQDFLDMFEPKVVISGDGSQQADFWNRILPYIAGLSSGGGSVAIPNGEVAYGNATSDGITSDSPFNYDEAVQLLSIPNILLPLTDYKATPTDGVIYVNIGGTHYSLFHMTTDPNITAPETRANLILGIDSGNFTMSGTGFQGGNTFLGNNIATGATTAYFNLLGGMRAGEFATTAHDDVALGMQALRNMSDAYNCVVIGVSAAYGVGGFPVTGVHDVVILGYIAGYGIRNDTAFVIIIGSGSTFDAGGDPGLGDYCIHIGGGVTAGIGSVVSSISMGYKATNTASHQVVIGGDDDNGYINDIYLGRGVVTAGQNNVKIQPSGRIGTNASGNQLHIAGGKATGNATGGAINFYTSEAGASGSTLQNLSLRASIDANGDLEIYEGKLLLDNTITPGGTTGSQTINKPSGTVNFAAAATSLTVTNDKVAADSLVFCQIMTNDATFKSCQVVVSAGSFVIHANAAATAETKVAFVVINE